MKVVFNDVEYSVKDLSYQEKRKLWHKCIIVMSDENNIDTVGAGDTFFALSALSIGSKIDSKIGLLISSLAASFSINQLGNISTFDLNILKKHLNHIFK